jgi:hypothetical protein
MPATTYTANLMAKAAAHGAAYQGPTLVYLALAVTIPTAGSAGTEVYAAEYARHEFNQTTAWDDDDAGALSNVADVEYPLIETEDYDDEVVAVEAYDDPTAGERLWYIIFTSPRQFVVGETPKFLTGDLVLEIV